MYGRQSIEHDVCTGKFTNSVKKIAGKGGKLDGNAERWVAKERWVTLQRWLAT